MQQLIERWIRALEYGSAVLVIAAVVFSALEHSFSFRHFKKPWKATLVDLQFYFVNLLLPPIVQFGMAALFALLITRRTVTAVKPSPFSFAVSLLSVLFLFDIWTYVRHRSFHSKLLWAFHSVHHSSEELNWISGERNHCAEVAVDLVGESLVFAFAALCGVGPRVLLVAGVVIGVWNFFVHSNTRWTFGPFRYVLVSPVWHRWHHSDSRAAMDKNFAVMFSCIDVIMGTFYMPPDRLPKTTGLYHAEKETFPKTFFGQLIHPFRPRAKSMDASSGQGLKWNRSSSRKYKSW